MHRIIGSNKAEYVERMQRAENRFSISVQAVYKNPETVDDTLVDLFHTPSGECVCFP